MFRSLLGCMGAGCALIGLLNGVMLRNAGWGAPMLYAASSSALLAGCLAWRVLLPVSARPSAWRGALAGGCAAVLGHYLCWWVLGLIDLALHPGEYNPPGSLAAQPLAVQAAVSTLFSLLSFWWSTLLPGVLWGALLGWRARRRLILWH